MPNSTLILNEAYVTNDEFSPSELDNLNPEETQTIDIIYTADSANASGSYRIYSNDSDEPEVLCETNGNIIGANVGDQAPDFNLDIVPISPATISSTRFFLLPTIICN